MAKMNCYSKGSSGSRASHRKSRSHSPSSNSLYASQNYLSLFGTSTYRPTCSSIGYRHPMSCHSQAQDFAESVKQSIDSKAKKKNHDETSEQQS